jgi:hypothetical protein
MLVERGDAGGGTREPRARHHGEPLSPFERGARRASRPRLDWTPTEPPLGDGGTERAGPGASYGDRRTMQARPRFPRPASGITAFHEAR